MTENIDLGSAIKLPPEKAVEYLEAGRGALPEMLNWQTLWQDANAWAFIVAKSLRVEALEDIQASLITAGRQGWTERRSILDSPHRIRNIFQASMKASHGAARLGSTGLSQLQNLDISNMEGLLLKADAADHAAGTIAIIQCSIHQGTESEHFRNFIEKTSVSDRHQWPVATITADKLRELGLPLSARVVRLRSDSLNKGHHRERYKAFREHEWLIIQEAIDHGNTMPTSDYKSRIWHLASDGRVWFVVLAYNKGGEEVYLKTAFPPIHGMEFIEAQIKKKKKGKK